MERKHHCQVCGRQIKAKFGRIAHHGYRRPGMGWQTASCVGAGGAPYAAGWDRLAVAAGMIQSTIDARQGQIDNHKARELPVPNPRMVTKRIGRYVAQVADDDVQPGAPDYARLRVRHLERLRQSVAELELDLRHILDRFEYRTRGMDF